MVLYFVFPVCVWSFAGTLFFPLLHLTVGAVGCVTGPLTGLFEAAQMGMTGHDFVEFHSTRF